MLPTAAAASPPDAALSWRNREPDPPPFFLFSYQRLVLQHKVDGRVLTINIHCTQDKGGDLDCLPSCHREPGVGSDHWWFIINRDDGEREEEFHLVAPILHPEDNVVTVGVSAIMLVYHSPCCQVRWREMLAPCWCPKHDQLPMSQAPDGRHFHLFQVITITDLKVVGAGEGP